MSFLGGNRSAPCTTKTPQTDNGARKITKFPAVVGLLVFPFPRLLPCLVRGDAQSFAAGPVAVADQMTGEVGSFRYMAPELVKHEPYNTSVDIYSWAILSWEMLTIDKPYTGINESTFMKVRVLGARFVFVNVGPLAKPLFRISAFFFFFFTGTSKWLMGFRGKRQS